MPSSKPAPAIHSLGGVTVRFRGIARWLANEMGYGVRLLRWWVVWPVVLLAVAMSVVAYQLPGTYVVDIGSRQDQAYTRNFHTRLEEPGRTYRWSDAYGYVTFPGAGGSRPFTLTVSLDTERLAPVEIHVNGERLFADEVKPGWQELSFRIDGSHPSALASRDTVVEFRAPEYRVPGEEGQTKGLKVDRVVLAQSPTGGFIWPPLATLGFIALSTVLVYLFVGRALRDVSHISAIRVRALAFSLVVGAAMCLLALASHIVASSVVPHIATTLSTMLVILVAVERLARALFRGIDWRIARLLALTAALAFGVRYGGMALPQSVIIDMPYHMKWLRTLIAGDWQALYFPGGLSEVPPEWGMSLLIPKSPLFYIAVAPTSILPFDLETLVQWLICALDTSVVLFAFWLTRSVGASQKAAVAAAFLYAMMPLAFRALSYGILPTIFAQWLAIGLLVLVLASMEKGWRPSSVVWAVLLATLTLLAFPTVALFVTLVVLLVPIGWRLACSNDSRRQGFNRQPYAVLAAAWLLSIVAYYGLYVESVLASAQALLAPAQEGGTTVKWPGGPLQLVTWTADYLASVLLVVLAAIGVLLLYSREQVQGMHSRATILLAVWLAIGPIFMVANYKVDMIGKHLFFIMLPIAVAAGIGVMSLRRRGAWGGRFVMLLMGTVAWQAVVFWVERLVLAST